MKILFIKEDYKTKVLESKIIPDNDISDEFWNNWYSKVFPDIKDNEYIYVFRIYEKGERFYDKYEHPDCGIMFFEAGLTSEGMGYYTVIPKNKNISKEEIKKAKRKLKIQYDVTHFSDIYIK